MVGNENRDQERDRVVNETLDLIDNLDVDQARSLLRCFAIDEENFDSHALETVTKTVRATCNRSGSDYDALCHFPNAETARLNREHLLNSLSVSREAERIAQKAAEQSQRADQSSRASVNVPNSDNSTSEGHHHEQRGTETRDPAPDLEGDPEFEKVETQRLFREGHVTINHYYMHKGPETQPQPASEPQPAPEPKPAPKPQTDQQPQPASEPQSTSKRKRKGKLCVLCNKRYLEKDNVLDEDGRPPCGYHPGQLWNYGRNAAAAFRKYGVHMTGRAWNCCRRAADSEGCHPEYHQPA